MTYTSSRFIAGAAMGLTAQAVQDRVDSTVGLFAATIAASAVGEGLEIAFATADELDAREPDGDCREPSAR